MDYSCEYCNNNYSTKWNLKNHQKTNKQCIKISSLRKEYIILLLQNILKIKLIFV